LALKTFDRLISEFKTDLTLQNQFCVKGWFITTDRNADALTKFKKSSVWFS
jgi:hypothetical protein